MMERAKLLAAIDCCLREDGCADCPMLDGVCDDPNIPYEWIPVPLIEDIRQELARDLHACKKTFK